MKCSRTRFLEGAEEQTCEQLEIVFVRSREEPENMFEPDTVLVKVKMLWMMEKGSLRPGED
jgi:hypothetical protein